MKIRCVQRDIEQGVLHFMYHRGIEMLLQVVCKTIEYYERFQINYN